jgi:hypothetical protein
MDRMRTRTPLLVRSSTILNKSAAFETPYRIDLDIDFNRYRDDRRRVAAESWCCYNTRQRWFRRILSDIGIARFEFEDLNEATMFWLTN